MEVTYTLTREDLAAFRRFHARHRAKWRGVNRFVSILLIVLWVAQVLIIAHIARTDGFLLALGPRAWKFVFLMHEHFLIGFLLYSIYLAYSLWGQKMLAARQGVNTAQLSQTKRLRISPGGVEVAAPQEHIKRAWSDVPDVCSDQDCLYLYTSGATAIVVPRRAFASFQQFQAFKAQACAFKSDPFLSTAQSTSAEDSAAVWPPRPTFSAVMEHPAPLTPELEDVPGALHLLYVTTKADLLRAQMFFLPRQRQALLSIFLPYVLASALWTFRRLPPAEAAAWSLAIAAVGTVLTLAWVTHKALTQRFARFPEGRPCETIARPDFLCDVTPDGRKIYLWPDVRAIQMQNGDIYIVSKAASGAVIPRTAFPNKGEAEAFAQTLRRFWQAGRSAAGTQSQQAASVSPANR